MQVTKKQAEFWSILLIGCIIIAGFILLVDFGIKSAILEESNNLRLKIEQWERENGRAAKATDSIGIDLDAPVDTVVSVPVLVDKSAGMEKDGNANGDQETAHTATNRRTNVRRQTNPRGIPKGI